MPIAVICDQCGKSYTADESLAGRRVRCRGCGHILAVPSPGSHSDDTPSLDSLAEVERSHAGADVLGATQPGMSLRFPAAVAHSGSPGSEGGSQPSGKEIEQAGRANLRFNFAGARELDLLLPWVLLLGSAVWLVVQASQANPPGAAWVRLSSSLAWTAAYAGLVWPIVYVALRAAGKKVGFQLPRTARWRAFVCYFPAFVLTATLWMLELGPVRAILVGAVGGLLVASTCVYVLFRLLPDEVPPTAAMGAGGYLLGLLLACTVLYGINHLLKATMPATVVANLAVSPFGAGFDWTFASSPSATVSANPVPRVRVFEAERAQRSEPPPSPPPAVESTPVISPALLEQLRNAAWAGLESSLPVGPVIDPGPQVAAPTSPLISRFLPATAMRQPADRFLFPITASPFLAAMRRDGDKVQIWTWDSTTWQRVSREPVTVRAAQGLDDFALSPDGRWIGRTSTFAGREIELHSTTSPERPPLTLPIEGASLHGFLPRDLLITRAITGGRLALDVFNYAERRQLDRGMLAIPPPEYGEGAFEIVGDCRFVALLNRDARGTAAVRCYALRSERNEPSREVFIAPPSGDWPPLPVGVAVASDSPRLEDSAVAVLYQHAGGSALYTYDLVTGRRTGEFLDRAGQVPTRPGGYTGPALRWLGTGKSRLLLVFGRTIVNPQAASIVGELDLSDVREVAAVDPRTLIFVCGSNRHPIPVRLELNLP
ncbi:MAG: hypothetical protein RMJ35_00965 [Phycisphaerales bacterium]|nr:hypothetical protein [Phycisphaerales bacterium]